MANVSKRDKCFQDAVDALNDTLPDDQKIPIQHQVPWGKVDNLWRPLGLGERFWNWVTNKTIPYRVPDWTLTIDGKPVAGDNKFAGDKFQPRVSPRSGQTQQQDQNEINAQQHPDKPEYQDLNLNPDTCKCNGEPQQEMVLVPAPAFGGVWVPGANPSFAPVPQGAPLPAPAPEPVPELLPEFFPAFAW